MDAVILAGGAPTQDSPLYPYTQGKSKAALQIGEKSMIQWVLDALEKSPSIENVVVVLSDMDLGSELQSSKVVNFLPAAEDIIENFRQGADAVLVNNNKAKKVAVISCDIPFLTPESVEWVVRAAIKADKDICYCVIEQSRMEERFPESSRSYVKLRDMSVCGGDFSIIDLDLYRSREDFWRKIFKARKSYLRQAALIGFDILLLLLLRRLSLAETVTRVTHRLEISGQGLICPYPEIGMDIDKPHQLKIARKELS
jgi:molybdopterin-guanine dinucleotide biosynthesis protein A